MTAIENDQQQLQKKWLKDRVQRSQNFWKNCDICSLNFSHSQNPPISFCNHVRILVSMLPNALCMFQPFVLSGSFQPRCLGAILKQSFSCLLPWHLLGFPFTFLPLCFRCLLTLLPSTCSQLLGPQHSKPVLPSPSFAFSFNTVS